jgi:hypothetical protein
MSGERYDNEIIVKRLATPCRPRSSVLGSIWRSFLEGAAMCGAAMHGWPSPPNSQFEVAGQEDKE